MDNFFSDRILMLATWRGVLERADTGRSEWTQEAEADTQIILARGWLIERARTRRLREELANLSQVEALLGRPVAPRGVVDARRDRYAGRDVDMDLWSAELDGIRGGGHVNFRAHHRPQGFANHVYTPTQARELASALNALADRIDGRG